MGGNISSTYTIEKFIKELCDNNFDIQDTQKDVLQDRLGLLLQMFNNNKNAYKEYKQQRKEVEDKEGKEKKDTNLDDEATKFEQKNGTNNKYSLSIAFCIQINKIFILNYTNLYLTVLRIMSFLSKKLIKISY